MVPARPFPLAIRTKGTIRVSTMRIRAGFRAAAAIAATALPLTLAGNAFASPRGDNGDVKIHNIATGTDEEAENPHVCQFYHQARPTHRSAAASPRRHQVPATEAQVRPVRPRSP